MASCESVRDPDYPQDYSPLQIFLICQSECALRNLIKCVCGHKVVFSLIAIKVVLSLVALKYSAIDPAGHTHTHTHV